MPQPEFLGEGDAPSNSDSLWVRWVKALGAQQNKVGALPQNNPRRTDPLPVIVAKLENALRGTAYGG